MAIDSLTGKLLGTLVVAIVCVGGLAVFKSTTPPERDNTVIDESDDSVWWDTTKLANVKTDDSWILDPEIPVNYIPVIGEDEVYMVLNNDGSVNRYRKREKNDDGAWIWSDIIEDDVPVAFKPVEGKEGIFSANMDGTEELFKYIRNADDSYAFVPVDENGNYTDWSIPHGDYIPKNFVSVDGKNLYAAINDYGVIIEFWERSVDDMGAISWNKVQREYQKAGSGVTSPYDNRPLSGNSTLVFPGSTTPAQETPDKTPTGIELAEGQTYKVETLQEIKTVGNWKSTYETVYTYIYNADGSLFATHKDGPKEIERVQVFAQEHDLSADAGAIEPTIDTELKRVSNGFTYKDNVSADVLAKLNAARTDYGIAPLSSNKNSDSYKIAKIIAADMAKYNYADTESPLYGTVDELAARYNINKTFSLNVWRCSEKTADEINTRFQTLENTSQVRMDSNASEVGIAIVANSGFYYICEVYGH